MRRKSIFKKVLLVGLSIAIATWPFVFSNSVLAQEVFDKVRETIKEKIGFVPDSEESEFVFVRDTPNYRAYTGDKNTGGGHKIKLEKDGKSIELSFLSAEGLIVEEKELADTPKEESSDSADLVPSEIATSGAKVIGNTLSTESAEISPSVQVINQTEEAGFDSKAKLVEEETERAVKYEEVTKNVDMVYKLVPAGIKELVFLKSKDSPNSFTFSLNIKNLSFRQEQNRSYYFFQDPKSEADQGEPIIRILRGVAKDASNSSTNEVGVEIKKDGDKHSITLSIPSVWLSSPERIFPVTLEHTFEVVPEKLAVKEEGSGASFSEVPGEGGMFKINRKLLEVIKDYFPREAKTDNLLEGQIADILIDKKRPSSKFILKRRNYPSTFVPGDLSELLEKTAEIKLALEGASNEETPQSKDNIITWGEVFPKVSFQEKTFDGNLQEVITLKETQSRRDFTFRIEEIGDNIVLDDTKGGYIMAKDKDTNEELFMIRAPQGIDSKDQRVDYNLILEGRNIKLIPREIWQFDKASFPIDLYLEISPVLWNEAIVKVGENCAEAGCSKDGDIIDIKPAGWNWGTEERRKYLIVKIPKMTEVERQRVFARTIKPTDPNDPNLSPENRELAVKAVVLEEDKERVSDTSNLIRFGIDYTSLVTPQELTKIRTKNQENPVVDARSKPDVIRKKTSPRMSVIPEDRRLAYKPAGRSSLIARLRDWLFPDVRAAGTVIKSIGSATGRNYSTLTLWEDGEDGDLVTAQEIHKGEAYKDSDFNEQLTIDGSTTSSSYYMWITAAPSQRHNGTAGTGVKVKPTSLTANSGSNYAIINVLDTNSLVEWLEITEAVSASNDGTMLWGIHFNTGGGGTAQNNVVYKLDARSTHRGIEFNNVPTNIYNNIIYDMEIQGGGSGRGIQTWLTSGTANIYNNTTHSNAHHGVNVQDDGSGIINLKNNIATNNSTLDFTFPYVPGTENCSNNLSSDATADDNGCTSAQISKTTTNQFVSITANSENLHLKAGADALNNGADLSGTFVKDIDDTIRPQGSAFDIGADEYPATLLDMLMRHGKYFNASGVKQAFTW